MRVVWLFLSWVYGLITAIRGWLYDSGALSSYSSTLPVISVGNVTAGGNGKTPLCIAIASELSSRGYRPAILSRGYGGKTRGPYRVSPSDSPKLVGDEAVLMTRSGIPVFVARSRVEGVKMIEALGEADVVILDDGLQHRALHRDLDIVSIFAGSEMAVVNFVKGELLPAGMFRENRDRALNRASLVVVSYRTILKADELPEIDARLLRILPENGSVFRSYLRPTGVVSLLTGEALPPQRVCAFAAIANPTGFFSSLEAVGFTIAEKFSFRDHHHFSEWRVASLVEQHPELYFVCTAKDAVKLSTFSEEVKKRCAVLLVDSVITPSDVFLSRIEEVIRTKVSQKESP